MNDASAPTPAPLPPAAWRALRQWTDARIALGRTGGSVRCATLLDFRLAHARARDAVHAPFDATAFAAELTAAGIASRLLATAAADRTTYLQRPDLGRRLDDASRVALAALSGPTCDVALIVSDGLSALAAARHAGPTVQALSAHFSALGWRVAPVLIVPFARVKVQDEIGALLGVRHTVMLLGERPGLGAPDSLGAYFTHRPHADCTDADRNCVSSIRLGGLPPAAAATKLTQLLLESARLGLSGVHLKDTQLPPLPDAPVGPTASLSRRPNGPAASQEIS